MKSWPNTRRYFKKGGLNTLKSDLNINEASVENSKEGFHEMKFFYCDSLCDDFLANGVEVVS